VKRLPILFGLAVIALGLLGVSSAANRPLAGALDPSFGDRGVVMYSLGPGTHLNLTGLVVQPDGEVVVGGGADYGDRGFILGRFEPDGTLDPSFGNQGIVQTPFPDSFGFVDATALQADGKIVVAGDTYGGANYLAQFTIARYTSAGALDPSFGKGGITSTPIDEGPYVYSTAFPEAVTILTSGKILVGGIVDTSAGSDAPTDYAFVLARYSADGSLDSTFGKGGLVQTHFLGNDTLSGMGVEPDGKVVAAGTAQPLATDDKQAIAVARYLPDGSLDSTFGSGGKVVTHGYQSAYLGSDVALRDDGSIVVVGEKDAGPWPVLARYQPDGSLDPRFGTGGIKRIKRFKGELDTLLRQPGGELIASGVAGTGPHAHTFLARFRADGAFDSTFGRGGLSLSSLPLGQLAVGSDGRIVTGGFEWRTSISKWFLARFVGGSNCVVPRVRGDRVARARRAIRHGNCKPGLLRRRYSNSVPRSRLISPVPAGGTRLSGGSKVNLVVSKGKRR
jgi:uncharacterized delta-60 repeat protein